ncbi:hypothetical protein AKJ18_11075 [Vibrio xuii]|nr:hypothetical protein AKJ18_11075 [Vibrio xuii]
MYTIDLEFTSNYLRTLKNFCKFVLTRCSELPRTQDEQLSIFFTKLHDTLSRVIRKGARVNEEISIDPNIIFKYKNPIIDGRKFHISLGGVIKLKRGTIIEQSLCLNLMLEHTDSCDEIPEAWNSYPLDDHGYHILRRFHFDFDAKNNDNGRPKFHLQYGGNFESRYLGVDDSIHYKLFSPIDHPRLPQQPYDIVMLLDFMLREFELGGHSVINDSGWNKHVIACEKIWLSPYYENILNRLNCSARATPIHRIE